MYRNELILIYLLFFTAISCHHALGNIVSSDQTGGEALEKNSEDESLNPLEKAILAYQSRADIAQASAEKGILPEQEVDKLFEEMLPPLENIIDLMKEPNNVYKFIETKGLERVVLPNLKIDFPDLRAQLLKLIQLLFDEAPTTTSVMIPITILDRLLEIYEDDDSLAIKSKTVDILYSWLPDNPKVQARVMKIKGLDPFYDQVHKLDASVVHKMLKLFSKVVKEHIKARDDSQQKTKTDLMKANIYKKIGLIERLQTNRVCHGLFNIFQNLWENGDKHINQELLIPIFDILGDIQPYCTDSLRGRAKAINMLNELNTYVKELGEDARELYEDMGVNVTKLENVLKLYVNDLSKLIKDEL